MRHMLPAVIKTVIESRERNVCSRWISLLLFALVFLSQLICVDVKGLEGVDGQ